VRVLMVASEALPFAKTGGLADVLSALPRALARLGHSVDVIIPRYRGVAEGSEVARLRVSFGPVATDTAVTAVTESSVRFLFVDRPEYYDREYLYSDGTHDYPDNAERFGFLAQTAMAWVSGGSATYDVVHVHDWQAGLVPVLATTTTGFPSVVLTIHNLSYQGTFDTMWLSRLGLDWSLMRPDALEYWGRISFLKGGILFSDVVTTVSPRYAREIQTPEFGFGFDGVVRARAADLVGILNGIDYDQWDPARDANLPMPFTASNLEGKDAAKRGVLDAFGLPASDREMRRPLVGMISRLVDQKGFDLLAMLADELPRLNAAFVLLGTGDRRYEALWSGLSARYPGQISARIGFDEGLAHLIEGGADMFLMPSRFEPCGLNQMYSLRYGTVPLVRATGGLADTVRNLDPRTGEGTGFTFDDYTPQALLGTLRWALDVYEDRTLWRRLQVSGMQQDHSWERSAREYVRVYERAHAQRRRP
jgi:starch synthase